MQLRESIEKTKTFLQTTLLNLKSLLFHGYHKLPRPHFSCGNGSNTTNPDHLADHEYYTNFCNELECDLDKIMRLNSNMVPASKGDIQPIFHAVSPLQVSNSPVKEDKNSSKKSSHCKVYGVEEEEEEEAEEEEQGSSNRKKKKKKTKKKSSNEDSYLLARKMKELEMMDVSDMEHVLDVEEAIHYYSRLKSPVYLDIVDKFFTDIYQDFSISHPSSTVTVNSSKRRLGSFRL
ncbi:hypothetical protein LINGRAHAP2_LOCUS7347 [Linum grandiflorum]